MTASRTTGATKRVVAHLERRARDPLFAFLLLGAAIFAVEAWWGGDDSRTIVVAAAELDRLGAMWAAQMGRKPSASELDGLLEEHIREEILVREAKRLRLDDGDVIVRRRLAQKLSFLTEDVAVLQAPEAAALKRFFKANQSRYGTPAVVTFSHIYFSPERREDAAGDALNALAGINPEAWRRTGDPFLLGRTYAHASLARVRSDFGAEFAERLAALEADAAWQGPLESGYGFHLVRIDAKSPARGADYESVAERVLADFDAERRAAANRAYFEDLRSEYTVVLP